MIPIARPQICEEEEEQETAAVFGAVNQVASELGPVSSGVPA